MSQDAPATGTRRISRRALLRLAVYGSIAAAATVTLAEPRWLRIRRLRLEGGPGLRFVHFTDTHHKGALRYLNRVVDAINALEPGFVCFTGDLIEEAVYLDEALGVFARIEAPLFGVPGNHDYWSHVPFAPIAACFAATGGAWLVDECVEHAGIVIAGRARFKPPLPENAAKPVLALTHFPKTAEEFHPGEAGLILAGHSHGGQVRIPGFGAPIVPGQVRPYDLGLYQKAGWQLYVNPGIGTWLYPVRLFCRPEITLIEW